MVNPQDSLTNIQQIDPQSDDLRFKSENNSTFVNFWRDPLPSQLPLGDPWWRLWNLYNEAIGNWFSIVVPSLNCHIIFTHAIKKSSISSDEIHIHPHIYPHFHDFFVGSLLKLHTNLGIPTPRRNSGPTSGTGATFGSPFGKKNKQFSTDGHGNLYWLVVYLPLWKIWVRPWEGFSHIWWKNVWNQQPDTFICTQKRCCLGCIADQDLWWKWLEYYHHRKKCFKHWNDKESVF